MLASRIIFFKKNLSGTLVSAFFLLQFIACPLWAEGNSKSDSVTADSAETTFSPSDTQPEVESLALLVTEPFFYDFNYGSQAESFPFYSSPNSFSDHPHPSTFDKPLWNGSAPPVYFQPISTNKIPPWLTLITMPLTVALGFIINASMFIRSNKHREKERNASVTDDYWLRKVVIPDLKDSLSTITSTHLEYWIKLSSDASDGESKRNLVTSWRTLGRKAKLDGPSKSLSDYLDKNLQDDTHHLTVKIEKLSLFDADFIKSASECLDNFEISIVNKCYKYEHAEDDGKRLDIARQIAAEFRHLTLDVLMSLMDSHKTFAKNSQ